MSELPIAGSYRPTVMGREGAVASGHYLASLAAQRILDRGGNAVDAGVAAGLCTCVLQTDMVDLAGVAPIIIYLAEEDRVVTISGLGRWPRAASVEYFQRRHGGRIPIGVERSITPTASATTAIRSSSMCRSRLRIERRLAEEVGGALADRGHRVVTWPDWTWRAGGVCAITIDRERGVLAAGADPRRTSYAIGW